MRLAEAGRRFWCVRALANRRSIAARRIASRLEFSDHLDEVRQAMDELASRYEPAELNRIGFRLYEKLRPDMP
jgi:hypothetical protein